MSRRVRIPLAALAALAAAVWAVPVTAAPGQASAPSVAPTLPAPTSAPVPGDVDRIRRALTGPAPIRLEGSGLRFYVDVVARQRTFADYVQGVDLVNGKTKRGNPMTHRDFENLVTPREFQRQGGLVVGW